MLDRKLAGGDDALGLVADVEQDLVAVDLDDGAFDDVAVVEVLDRRSMAARKSSADPMSLMATCGAVRVGADMCWGAPTGGVGGCVGRAFRFWSERALRRGPMSAGPVHPTG